MFKLWKVTEEDYKTAVSNGWKPSGPETLNAANEGTEMQEPISENPEVLKQTPDNEEVPKQENDPQQELKNEAEGKVDDNRN